MGQQDAPISAQSLAILRLIAAGRSYDQILLQHPDLDYQDIFNAAREALYVLEQTPQDPLTHGSGQAGRSSAQPTDSAAQPPTRALPGQWPTSIETGTAPRQQARAEWTPEEDAQLERLHRHGAHLAEIGQALGRHHGAIKARLTQLGFDAEVDSETLLPYDALAPSDRPGPGSAPLKNSTPLAPRASSGWEAIRRRLEGRSDAD